MNKTYVGKFKVFSVLSGITDATARGFSVAKVTDRMSNELQSLTINRVIENISMSKGAEFRNVSLQTINDYTVEISTKGMPLEVLALLSGMEAISGSVFSPMSYKVLNSAVSSATITLSTALHDFANLGNAVAAAFPTCVARVQVFDEDGNEFKRVSSAPAAGEFEITAATTLTFNAADEGKTMRVSYVAAPTSTVGTFKDDGTFDPPVIDIVAEVKEFDVDAKKYSGEAMIVSLENCQLINGVNIENAKGDFGDNTMTYKVNGKVTFDFYGS